MNDRSILYRPRALEAILRETADLGFSMASELQTGSLLRNQRADFRTWYRHRSRGFWTTRQSLQSLATQPFMALDCLNSCCGVE
jgi:hypothetical protein